jgi:hypothetical protein
MRVVRLAPAILSAGLGDLACVTVQLLGDLRVRHPCEIKQPPPRPSQREAAPQRGRAARLTTLAPTLTLGALPDCAFRDAVLPRDGPIGHALKEQPLDFLPLSLAFPIIQRARL